MRKKQDVEPGRADMHLWNATVSGKALLTLDKSIDAQAMQLSFPCMGFWFVSVQPTSCQGLRRGMLYDVEAGNGFIHQIVS